MSADFPHDVDSPSERASHEEAQEESASPTGSTPVPASEDSADAQGEGRDVEVLPDPGPAVALDALRAVSLPPAAEVLTTGPDGELERLGSTVSPASDAEILEVLSSLQFEGGRVVAGVPGVSSGDAPTEARGALGGEGDGTGSQEEAGASSESGTLGVLVSQPSSAPPVERDPTPGPEDARSPEAHDEVDASEAQKGAHASRGGRALPGSEGLPELTIASAGGDDDEDREDEDEDDEEALEAHLRASVARRQAPVPTTLIALDRLDEDTTFRVREEGDVSRLATDLARVGQLFPIDVRQREGDRFQVICGFRRLAALRFLHREFVIARVHADLRDEDAQLMALAAAIHAEPVELEQLEALREQLEAEGRLVPAVRDMLDKALAEDDGLAPELAEEEIDADELASDVSQRLGVINQELSMLADVFASLEPSRQAELLMQLRYSSELVTYLEGQTS